LAAAIIDWRDTNSAGAFQTYYATRPIPYQAKNSPFETVDELRLVYGADMATLVGEDANRNGILDPNETDENQNGLVESGVLEYVTIYSREPNTQTNGSARINIRLVSGTTGPFASLLQTTFGQTRADQILTKLGLISSAPAAQRGPNAPARNVVLEASFRSPRELYIRS